jgi:carbon-monoxide dehydrogenase large subunit
MGVCVCTLMTGSGPFEGAEVRVDGTGHVSVLSGCTAMGQGPATTLSQIVASELGVPVADVHTTLGDTARFTLGIGSFASRTTVVAGTAAALAARMVRDKACQLAAHLLEADPGDVEFVAGRARVRGAVDRSLSLAELAVAAGPGGNRPPAMQLGLEARHFFEVDDAPYAFGVHVVEAEVESATGVVSLRSYYALNDAGRLVNPTLADGQVLGGIAQGLGGALLEELAYDEQGQLMTTSLMDYLLPTSLDVPHVQVVFSETPSPLNPLGLKGIGEIGAVAAPAAIANAVSDALAHLGVEVLETPLHPSRVRGLIAAARVPV